MREREKKNEKTEKVDFNRSEKKTSTLSTKTGLKKTLSLFPLSFPDQKPTGAVRVLSFAGTLALGGVLLYFWNQNEKQQKLREEQVRKRQW